MARAQLFFQLQLWEKALNDYKQVATLSSNNGLGHIGMGDCFGNMKSYKNAINAYTRAIQVDSNSEETAREKRRNMWYRACDYEQAMEDNEKVLLRF